MRSTRDPRPIRASRRTFFALLLAATAARSARAGDHASDATIRTDEVVAGGPGDFMEVRHVVLAGTNFEIGKALATIAKERYGAVLPKSADAVRTRAQRRYMAERFPAYHERQRGAAAAFGADLEDDALDFNGIPDPALGPKFDSQRKPGCSVVFYPPASTADGVGVLSRNYDFSTGTLFGQKPAEGHRAATSRPMILELHPDSGYASLCLSAYDLLGGVIDGINSKGLSVALLAVDEQFMANAVEAQGPPSVGLGVLATLRMLLDTCADVDEAKQALLVTKQYYEAIPCHYMIADAQGRSFVWERSFGGNFDYVFDGQGKPQIVTNYSLHKHPDIAKLPKENSPLGACNRSRRIADEIAAHSGKFELDDIRRINRCVAQEPPAAPMSLGPSGSPSGVAGRTLWHALYVLAKRSLSIDFYLRDEPDAGAPGGTKVVRSGYREFELRAMR